MADVSTMFYHGIRQNIRRVLTALGPDRVEKGLTAFEDGASNWSECFFARAFSGEYNLHAYPHRLREIARRHRHSPITYYICELLGDDKHTLRVAVRDIWHTFDSVSTHITRAELRKFIEDVLDESRPQEVLDLLKSIDYSNIQEESFACA